MEYIKFIIIALILFYLIKRLFPVKGVRNISTDELKSELKNKSKEFVDVRTQAEFKGNHIKGFKNIPLHQLNQKVQSLSKEKEIIVICQSGMRSNKACKILKKHGYKYITNVKGGIMPGLIDITGGIKDERNHAKKSRRIVKRRQKAKYN